MAKIANVPVVVVPHPEGPAPTEDPIGAPCGARFPRSNDVGERTSKRLDQYVDVIWHHAPLDQSVEVAVAMKKGVLDESRYRWTPQVAGAIAGVLEAAHAAGQSGCLHLVEYTLFLFLLGAPASQQMLRNAVRQAETNTLDERSLIQMRVVATRVPARRPVLPLGFVAPHESREAGVARDGTTNDAAVAGRKVSLQFYTHLSAEASKNTGCKGLGAPAVARAFWPAFRPPAPSRSDVQTTGCAGRCAGLLARVPSSERRRAATCAIQSSWRWLRRKVAALPPPPPAPPPPPPPPPGGGGRMAGRRTQCFGAPSVWRTRCLTPQWAQTSRCHGVPCQHRRP